jgi:hypothetical protein
MKTADLEAKQKAVAEIIEGRVVVDEKRVPICVKGSVLGFPATLEAISPGFPFGVNYYLETKVGVEPSAAAKPGATITITPRYGKGWIMGFLSHILFFEATGLPVGDKRLESRFIFNYTNQADAHRFLSYPGIADSLAKLEHYCKFSELTVKSDAGLALSQPRSFAALDLDVCRETFRILGQMGQVLFEAF